MLQQRLDQLTQNDDGDRRLIVSAATIAIHCGNLGHFQALMNNPSTATALQTVKMLETFVKQWQYLGGDHKEWTKLVTGLLNKLASDSIPSPHDLLATANSWQCTTIVNEIYDRAEAYPAFAERLLQATDGRGYIHNLGSIAVIRRFLSRNSTYRDTVGRDTGTNILLFSTPKGDGIWNRAVMGPIGSRHAIRVDGVCS